MKEEHIEIDSYPFSGQCSYYEFCFHRLLPKYASWVTQSASIRGDRSQCAMNFLYKILPYLVTTVIQNGIYFIKDFPNHYFTHLLLSIPEYSRFAIFQRNEVKNTVRRYKLEEVSKLQSLGENVSTVVGSLQSELFETNRNLTMHRDIFQQQVLTMQQQMINLQTSFMQTNQALQQLSTNQQQLFNTIQNINIRQEEMFEKIGQLKYNTPEPVDNSTANISNNRNNVTVTVHNHTIVQPVLNENTELNHPTNAIDNNGIVDVNAINQETHLPVFPLRNRRPRMNPLDSLNGNPRIPPMTARYGPTWLHVLNEWENENLATFIPYGRRQHFGTLHGSRFSKRLRGIIQLQRVARDRDGQSIRVTAEQLDIERVNRPGFSITDQLNELQRNDPNLRRRQVGI